MPAHVDDDAMLRLIVRERFPSWRSVLNEQAASQLAAEQRERRRVQLAAALPPDEPADRLAIQRRKRLIQERQMILTQGIEELPEDQDAVAGQ